MILNRVLLLGLLALSGLAACDRHAPPLEPAPALTLARGMDVELAPKSPDSGQELRVLWATLDERPTSRPLIAINAAARPKGGFDLVARDGPGVIYHGLDRDGVKRGLRLPGEWLSAATTERGDVWLVGLSGRKHMLAPGFVVAKAQVARLGSDGLLLWSKSYGSGLLGSASTFRLASSVVALPSGGAIVAGQVATGSWIARVSDEGTLLWEQRFGVGQDIAIASINGVVLVATMEVARTDSYREDLILRVYGEDGVLKTRSTVREGLNFSASAHYGEIDFAHRGLDIYLLSGFEEFLDPVAFELAKVTASGRVEWRRQLPTTVGRDDKGRRRLCAAGVTVLADGSALVACPSSGQIALIQVLADNSALKTSTVPAPRCHHPNGPVSVATAGGRLNLLGAPPASLARDGLAGRDCTWFGEVVNSKGQLASDRWTSF